MSWLYAGECRGFDDAVPSGFPEEYRGLVRQDWYRDLRGEFVPVFRLLLSGGVRDVLGSTAAALQEEILGRLYAHATKRPDIHPRDWLLGAEDAAEVLSRGKAGADYVVERARGHALIALAYLFDAAQGQPRSHAAIWMTVDAGAPRPIETDLNPRAASYALSAVAAIADCEAALCWRDDLERGVDDFIAEGASSMMPSDLAEAYAWARSSESRRRIARAHLTQTLRWNGLDEHRRHILATARSQQASRGGRQNALQQNEKLIELHRLYEKGPATGRWKSAQQAAEAIGPKAGFTVRVATDHLRKYRNLRRQST